MHLPMREVAEIAAIVALKHLDDIDLGQRRDLRLVSVDLPGGKAMAWVERISLWFWAA